MSSNPNIAIIGGGLGGLSLLRSLSRRGIAATVYERDASFSARSHLGGTLDLHGYSGQRAMRENGLWAAFEEHSRPEGDEMRICDFQGNVVFYDKDFVPEGGPPPEEGPGGGAPGDVEPETRPEIDRTVLRKILLDSCPQDSIKWDCGLTSIRALQGSQHELGFSDGSTVISDLVIGADGARSKVRPVLSDAAVSYVGLNGVEVSLAPEVAASLGTKKYVGEGTVAALKSGTSLHAQMNGDGRIRTYAWFKDPGNSYTVPAGADPAAVKKDLLTRYEGWAPWLRQLVEHCDPSAIYHRPLYVLPIGHSWPHQAGITLLGDAMHLMSPFAGAGANMALLDGVVLGDAIAKGLETGKLDEEVQAYEQEAISRSAKEAQEADDNMRTFFDDEAPGSVVELMKRLMSGPPPQ